MKYVYPAIFKPIDEGFEISVPDLSGTITFGTDLADALEMAKDATEMWLWDAENKSEPIPKASSNESLVIADNCFVNLIMADTDEYRKQNDTRSIKKTLSIPAWLNWQAEKANAPYSQLLQEALKDYLKIK